VVADTREVLHAATADEDDRVLLEVVPLARETFRSAEFGFFGVVVYTRTQTPRFWGQALRAGDAVLKRAASRPWRMS
jgi:hypothetical protein